MRLSTGDRLGTYEILALIGTGGMGEVYRARDTGVEREVAVSNSVSGGDRELDEVSAARPILLSRPASLRRARQRVLGLWSVPHPGPWRDDNTVAVFWPPEEAHWRIRLLE